MEIEELGAEALDQAVATQVFGRQPTRSIQLRYSTDLASAWDIVRGVTGERGTIEFRMEYSSAWLTVSFLEKGSGVHGEDRIRRNTAGSIATSICRAALKFVKAWEAREKRPWSTSR